MPDLNPGAVYEHGALGLAIMQTALLAWLVKTLIRLAETCSAALACNTRAIDGSRLLAERILAAFERFETHRPRER